MKTKSNRKILFSSDLIQLCMPLLGKPALFSSVIVVATYASMDCPRYAPFLLLPIILATHYFSRKVQWVVFLSLAAACISHEISCHASPDNTSVPPQETGCGIVESIQQKTSGQAVVIQTIHAGENQPNTRIRLTEKRILPQYPLPGDSLCYEASFYPVTPPSVPGAFDTRNWLHSQQLAAYGKFIHWTVYRSTWVPEREFYRFRQWIRSQFSDFLDESETGLLLGLLAGDRSQIPDALRSDFQRSGLVHVLAISGFHVVLLAGILMIFLKATGLPHRMVRIIAIAFLFLYVPVTGGSPP